MLLGELQEAGRRVPTGRTKRGRRVCRSGAVKHDIRGGEGGRSGGRPRGIMATTGSSAPSRDGLKTPLVHTPAAAAATRVLDAHRVRKLEGKRTPSASPLLLLLLGQPKLLLHGKQVLLLLLNLLLDLQLWGMRPHVRRRSCSRPGGGRPNERHG